MSFNDTPKTLLTAVSSINHTLHRKLSAQWLWGMPVNPRCAGGGEKGRPNTSCPYSHVWPHSTPSLPPTGGSQPQTEDGRMLTITLALSGTSEDCLTSDTSLTQSGGK